MRHKQALHFSTVSHAGAVAQSPRAILASILTSHKEGVFPIIGPAKRGIEKGVADGIVAAIRQLRAQWIGPKPPRLKRGDAVRILKGSLAHHVGLEVLLSLLEGSQRVTLPESDVWAASG